MAVRECVAVEGLSRLENVVNNNDGDDKVSGFVTKLSFGQSTTAAETVESGNWRELATSAPRESVGIVDDNDEEEDSNM